MSDIKWIKITTDIFDDEKILLIEGLPSADTLIVVWFKLLILAGKQNNNGVFIMGNGLPYTDEMLATIFRRDLNTIRLALRTFEQFGMIEIIENVITIPNWNKHQTLDAYEKKKIRDKEYQKQRRAKQKLTILEKSSDASFYASSDNTSYVAVSDKEEDKDKEEDIDKRKNKKKTSFSPFSEIESSDLPDHVKESMKEWVTYKQEKKDQYKSLMGFQKLLTQVKNHVYQYGEQAVCELISECMSNNWKGIIWDKLKSRNTTTSSYKPSTAEMLEDSYKMMNDWAKG